MLPGGPALAMGAVAPAFAGARRGGLLFGMYAGISAAARLRARRPGRSPGSAQNYMVRQQCYAKKTVGYLRRPRIRSRNINRFMKSR